MPAPAARAQPAWVPPLRDGVGASRVGVGAGHFPTLLDFLVTPTTDTRAVERFRLPADKRAGLDFDSRPVPDFIALSGRYQTVIDPTLATFDFIQQRDGEMSAPCAAVADHLPPDIQRGLRVSEFPIPDDATAERYRASCAKVVDFVGRLYRAGVPLVAGTDACAGITLAGELALYVKAGLTPAQVLQIATLNGATHTRTLAVSAWPCQRGQAGRPDARRW